MITPELFHRYVVYDKCEVDSSGQRANQVVLDSDQHCGQTLEFSSTVTGERVHEERNQ